MNDVSQLRGSRRRCRRAAPASLHPRHLSPSVLVVLSPGGWRADGRGGRRCWGAAAGLAPPGMEGWSETRAGGQLGQHQLGAVDVAELVIYRVVLAPNRADASAAGADGRLRRGPAPARLPPLLQRTGALHLPFAQCACLEEVSWQALQVAPRRRPTAGGATLCGGCARLHPRGVTTATGVGRPPVGVVGPCRWCADGAGAVAAAGAERRWAGTHASVAPPRHTLWLVREPRRAGREGESPEQAAVRRSRRPIHSLQRKQPRSHCDKSGRQRLSSH